MYSNDTYHSLLGLLAIALLIVVCFLSINIYWKVRAFFRQQVTIKNLAYTDQLTGFRNFPKFVLDAQHLLGKFPNKNYAIWSFDIKKFHLVNTVFGSATGDRVLRRTSMLFDSFEKEDTAFCRNTGDQFVGIRPYAEKEELEEWFSELVTQLDVRKVLLSEQFPSNYAMGFYCIENSEEQLPIKDMVNYASFAKRVAKAQAHSHPCFFSMEMKQKVNREAELVNEGRSALLQGEFTFVVQPKVSIGNGFYVIGGEVLVRWHHPYYGRVSPSEFIPLFESNGLVIELDRKIFEQVCSWYNQCRNQNILLPNLAINVSRQGLLQDDFVDYYSSVKQDYAIEDDVLELEITENMLLEEFDSFRDTMIGIRDQGFICSLDDFGSGYSSLNTLQNLPIDVLKLDAFFFRDGVDVERVKIITSTIIDMAHRLGIKIVAEGIELPDQVDFLQRAGCDVIQGYVFSKPLSQEDFITLLAKNERRIEIQEGVSPQLFWAVNE